MFNLSVSTLIKIAIKFSEKAVAKAQFKRKQALEHIDALKAQVADAQAYEKAVQEEIRMASSMCESLTNIRDGVKLS